MATTGEQTLALRTSSLTGRDWVGVLAAAVTGVVHLFLGIRFAPAGLGIAFLLAGLGFAGAIVLVLIGFRRRTVYAVGIPYTLVQIVAWYYLNFVVGAKAFPADVGTLGAVDKVAQVVLLVVLVLAVRATGE